MFLELVALLFSFAGALGVDCEKACHPNETCCPGLYPSEPNCCPFENAVCCDDGTHCCPEGSFCDLDVRMCVMFAQPQVTRDTEEEMTPIPGETRQMRKRIDNFEEEMTAGPGENRQMRKRIDNFEEEMTTGPGENRQMRKRIDNFEEEMTAGPGENRQMRKRIGDTEEEMTTDPNDSGHVKNDCEFYRLIDKISGVAPMFVHCDRTQYCLFPSTCCRSLDPKFFYCCPNPEAVCCSDGEHCCRRGEECDSTGMFCLSEVGLHTEVREADITKIRYTKHDKDFVESSRDCQT